MFGASRREIEELQRQLAAARAGETAAQQRAEEAESRLTRLEAEAAEARRQVEFFHALVEHLHEFGESTKSVQTSMAAMAQTLREETRTSVRAASEMAQSQETVRRLTEHITGLTERAQASAASIDKLHERTGRINGIVQLIKEIADQTNLLALNAAIEAARAGEQGRGFAVVADEVRKLAEKSATSANEIDSITRTLNDKSDAVRKSIEGGLADIASSESSLDAVAEAINQSNRSVEEVGIGLDSIAAATEEQRRVSAEAFTNIEAIAAMARENSEAVENTARSVQRLEELAHQLQNTVGRFRI